MLKYIKYKGNKINTQNLSLLNICFFVTGEKPQKRQSKNLRSLSWHQMEMGEFQSH